MDRQSGATLIELVVSLIVLSILAAIGLPSLESAVYRTHGQKVSQSLYSTWLAANRHAVATSTSVVVCPGDAGGCRRERDWSEGWIAFADINGDRERSLHETLIVIEPPLRKGIALLGTAGRTRLVIQGTGSSAGSNVTWTRCDRRSTSKALTVVVANTGRIREGRPTQQAADECVLLARQRR